MWLCEKCGWLNTGARCRGCGVGKPAEGTISPEARAFASGAWEAYARGKFAEVAAAGEVTPTHAGFLERMATYLRRRIGSEISPETWERLRADVERACTRGEISDNDRDDLINRICELTGWSGLQVAQ